jgi:hypothetical protein
MNIKIDKDVPLPVHPGGMQTKYAPAVRALEVGDSFWLPKDSVGKGFPGAIRNLALTIGIKTTTRSVEQDGVKGWRVWRTAKDEEENSD